MEAADSVDHRRAVERHYDDLAWLYRVFWGEHIHHGLWLTPHDSPRDAQEQLVAHLAKAARIEAGDRVLDVGCGYGASGRWLAKRRGCRVTGLTASLRQARFARRRARTDPVDLVRGDAAMLPFRAASFDVVWVIECLEHLGNKRGFLNGAARLLRRGGRLALCSWQRGQRVSSKAPLVQEVSDAFLCPSLATADEYRVWCAAAGLRLHDQQDLTERVRSTWDILIRKIQRPWVKPLRWVMPDHVRRFAEGFPLIAQAYETGEMSYGLTVAERR